MASKRLSVIIPGYNNPDRWWRRCLDSVLKNLGDDDEIICVDDGSACKPASLSEYVQNDPRIKVIYRVANGGLSVARNDGMAAADGMYVTFVDSDDELLPDIYDAALDSLIEHNSDIVVFGVRAIWVGERLFKENVPQEVCVGEMDAVTLKKLYQDSLLNYAWNKVYRKSFLEKNKLRFDPGGVPCEDIIFVLGCAMAGAKWSSISMVGIKYFRTHNSLLSKYKSSYLSGTQMATDAWRQYKIKTADALAILGEIGEMSERDLWRGEWDNIWRPGSPYDLTGRWRFLCAHKEIAKGLPLWLYFVARGIYAFLRKHFYVTPIQRWHIKRMYSDVRTIRKLASVENV